MNVINTNLLIYIRNKSILKQIMENFTQNKLLELIRYNKKLQNSLNKSIESYIEYTKIEIEINPKEGREGEFINIEDEKDKPFFHIFFDDNNEEEKRYYLTKSDAIRKIKIIIDSNIKSFRRLFLGCEVIHSINFIKFNRRNITDMSYMFTGCSCLEKINFSQFSTNKVVNMKSMFSGCSKLVKLSLGNFNTNKVTNRYELDV